MKRKLLLLPLLTVLFWSCKYNSEEELYPPATSCSTDNVTYSGTVSNLLSTYACLSCHAGASPEGNVSLQGYTNVKTIANSGRLYGAISHLPGYHPMPQGAPMMNQCDINKIKAWIDAGALNN